MEAESTRATQCTDIGGYPLHYEVSGSGSPLLLMHGWGCDHTTVASIAATAARTHTVYNIDLPGFGASPEPDSNWTVEDYATLMEGLIVRLGLKSPVLIGHSFGGRVAIVMASRGTYDSIVLVDAAGVKPRRPLKYYLKVYSFKAARRLLPLIIGRERAGRRIERMRSRHGSADYASSSPRMRAIMSLAVNNDLRHLMPAVKAPVLLIWGENDTATPMRDARIMERLMPEAALVSFAGCGHYSFLDNPGQFAAVLSSFLNSRINH